MKTMLKTSFSILWMGLLLIGPGYAQPTVELPGDVKESIRARLDSGTNVGIVVGIIDADGPRVLGAWATSGHQCTWWQGTDGMRSPQRRRGPRSSI